MTRRLFSLEPASMAVVVTGLILLCVLGLIRKRNR
jgi:hypothetical protein